MKKTDLQQHISYHLMSSLSFKCGTCQKLFPTSKALQQHSNASSPCIGLTSQRQTSLAKSKYAFHDTYSCSVCGQSFGNLEDLKKHSKCGAYTKTFRNRDALHSHASTTRSIPRASQAHDCAEGENSSKGPEPLNTPKVKPAKAPVSPYSCFTCVKFFKNEAEVQKHMAEVHGVQPSALRNNIQSIFSTTRGPPAKRTGFGRTGGTEETRQQPPNLHRYQTRPQAFANASHASRPSPQPQNLSLPRVGAQHSNYPQTTPTISDPTDNPITTRVSQLQLPQDPVYVKSGEVIIYGNNRWTGIPVAGWAPAISLLAKSCHLPKFLQKIEYLPSPYNDNESSDVQEGLQDFEHSPSPSPSEKSKHEAIVLSSHKVVISAAKDEIVLLSAIDYLTGEVLISHLVLPYEQVDDWRSSTTGITLSIMDDALEKEFAVLDGWKAAREALWQLIDSDTILVGYTLRRDLDALRMIHGCGVDMAILTQRSAGGSLGRRHIALENLCRELLKFELQAHGERGLDCLEMAFAIRELVLWSINNKAKLTAWAKEKSKVRPGLGGAQSSVSHRNQVQEEMVANDSPDAFVPPPRKRDTKEWKNIDDDLATRWQRLVID